MTTEKLQNKAKSNSFAMIGAQDIPDVESDTEIKKEEVETELEISKMDYKDQKLNLKILMKVDLRNQDQLDYVIKEMKSNRSLKKPYTSFFPIKRLKGTVKKVHRLGMNTYSRFLYVNPVEGVLISY